MPTTTAAINLLPILPNEIASRDMIRKFDDIRAGGEMIKIPYDRIQIRPGFNVRTNLGNLNELADMIEAAGLINAITVDVLKDGTVYLTDGERRYRAIGMLRERSPELKKRFNHIKAIANSKETTELDRILTMVTSPTGKPLEDIEEAAAYVRMLNETDHEGKKIKAADIARITGKSRMHVSNRLKLAGITDEEKDAVSKGLISATAITELVKQGFDENERLLKIEEAKEAGGKLKVKKVMKPEKSLLREVLTDLLDDNDLFPTSTEFPLINGEDNSSEHDRLMDDEEAQYAGKTAPTKVRSKNLVDFLTASMLQAKLLNDLIPADAEKALDTLHKLTENLRNARRIAEALK